MSIPKFIFLAAFFLFGFISLKAQVQLSDQKGTWGVSTTDTTVDHSVPRLSSEKNSTVTRNNTTDNTSTERSAGNTDSVPHVNTDKKSAPVNKPKNWLEL